MSVLSISRTFENGERKDQTFKSLGNQYYKSNLLEENRAPNAGLGRKNSAPLATEMMSAIGVQAHEFHRDVSPRVSGKLDNVLSLMVELG